MQKNINEILNELKKAITNKEYLTISQILDDVLVKTYNYIIEYLLNIEESFRQVRKGTFFSTFSAEEIDVVRPVDSQIARSMHELWFIENSYYSDLDFVYEDYQYYGYHSACEYSESLFNQYVIERYDNLKNVIEYTEVKYGPVMIDI